MMDFDYYEEYIKQNIIMAVLIKKREKKEKEINVKGDEGEN